MGIHAHCATDVLWSVVNTRLPWLVSKLQRQQTTQNTVIPPSNENEIRELQKSNDLL